MTKQKMHVLLVVAIALLVAGTASWLTLRAIFGGPLEGDLSHDFGIVQIDRPFSILEHTFMLRNESDHALQLMKVTPTCGCTTTEWPQESVPSGEVLVIPVHLKLRRSQIRRSEIRLEFESGEMVVLHVEGAGRFKQPMKLTPNQLKLSSKVVRAVLLLEWFEESRPPNPTLEVPSGIKVETGEWRLAKQSDAHKGTPNEWTMVVELVNDGDVGEQRNFFILINTRPALEVSFTVESTDSLLDE